MNGLLNLGYVRKISLLILILFECCHVLTASHCSENYFKDETGRWTDGFEKNKDIGLFLATASLGSIYMWSPYLGLNSLISLLNHSSSQVRTGARLAVGLATAGIYNPLEDLTLNLLHQDLSLPITEKATKTVTSQFAASLLALALAYPNSAREDLLPMLLNAIQQGPLEVSDDCDDCDDYDCFDDFDDFDDCDDCDCFDEW